MITSLIPYPMIVSIAMMKTVSICVVGSSAIQIPYAPAGILILSTEVNKTTVAKIPGAIFFLIVQKEKII